MGAVADWARANPQSVRDLRRRPDFAIFNAFWFGVEDLARLADAADWQTIPEALATINQLQAGTRLRVILESRAAVPQIDMAMLPRVPWATIHGAIRAAAQGPTTLAADVRLDQNDADYALCAKAEIDDIARLSPSWRTDYVPTLNDCDKQTRHMRGWLAGLRMGNLAVGSCTYRAYIGEEFVGSHQLCIAVDTERSVWFIEPRTGEVAPITHTHFGYAFATRLVVIRLEF